MKCENCNKEHNGQYGSGRFCSESCKQQFLNKKSILSKRKNHFARKASRSSHGTWKCNKCGLICVTRQQLKIHLEEFHNIKHAIKIDGRYECPYCKKLFNSLNSYAAHSSRCKLNPNFDLLKDKIRNIKTGQQLSKKIQHGDVKPSFLGRKHLKSTREKISDKRSQNLDIDLKCGRRKDVKWYSIKNLKGIEFIVRGHWEENVAQKLNELNILWIRNKRIKYSDGNIIRTYNPDFYLPELNAYIEVKGYYPIEDQIKMKYVLDQNKDIIIYFIGENQYKEFLNNKIKLEECRLI